MPTRPKLCLVAAMTKDRVIGHGGAMPWHLPKDLQHFKSVTLGHPVLMGRKTYDSIIKSLGRPLPGRLNVVISRSQPSVAEGVRVYTSIAAALADLEGEGVDEIAVIGGGEIYRATIDLADRLEITLIDAELEGDTWFPAIDLKHWRVAHQVSHAKDETNAYDLTFLTFRHHEGSV